MNTVTTQIYNATSELLIPLGIPTKTHQTIETHPKIAQKRITNCSM